MSKNVKNLLLAFVALMLVVAMIAITYDFRCQVGWWAFADCFTLFMTVFCWMMSIPIGRMIPHSGKVLQKIALVFAVITAVAWMAEYIAYSCI